MSTYGFDPESRGVSVSWPTGRARRTSLLTVLPGDVTTDAADGLVSALDGLSAAIWDTYVHPASQFGDPDEPNTEAWRWNSERLAFPTALAAVSTPELPRNGMLVVSYCRVEECGNRVGRAVHNLALGNDFTALIADEVAREQAAVEAAEAGDLTGRASQALALSRIGASPTQIEVAWQVLLEDPLGSHHRLLTEFEPSAAAVAATACLRCAAEITEDVSGVNWTAVVLEADNIEAFPVLTPTEILTALAEGLTEREAVTGLLQQAHAVSDGELSGPEHLAAVIAQVQRMLDLDVDEEGLDLRLTPVDPRRPAPDMLEDLLMAVDACFLLWREYYDDPAGIEVLDDDAEETAEAEEDSPWSRRAAARFTESLQEAMRKAGSPN